MLSPGRSTPSVPNSVLSLFHPQSSPPQYPVLLSNRILCAPALTGWPPPTKLTVHGCRGMFECVQNFPQDPDPLSSDHQGESVLKSASHQLPAWTGFAIRPISPIPKRTMSLLIIPPDASQIISMVFSSADFLMRPVAFRLI